MKNINLYGCLNRNEIVQSKIDEWLEEAVHQMNDGSFIKVWVKPVTDFAHPKVHYDYTPTTAEYFADFC